MNDFNYEKWLDKHWNEKIADVKKYLNHKDIQDLEKLGIKIKNEKYTEQEWEILYSKLISYKDETKNKTIKHENVKDTRINQLIEKIEKIKRIYNFCL